MSQEVGQIVPFVLLATGAGIVGGVLALFWAPRVYARSAIQHFAAGVVIAAVAADLIPEVQKIGTPVGILGGFLAGGLVMIALKWVALKYEKDSRGKKLPVGIAAAAAVDTLVDGALISAGFLMGERLGAVLAIALTVELFFLTLSVGAEFHAQRALRRYGIVATTGIALMLVLGAALAFVSLRTASETTVAVCLAFGAAALLYLIAEELLVESIQAEESLFSTAMLFAGFAALLALKLLGPDGS